MQQVARPADGSRARAGRSSTSTAACSQVVGLGDATRPDVVVGRAARSCARRGRASPPRTRTLSPRSRAARISSTQSPIRPWYASAGTRRDVRASPAVVIVDGQLADAARAGQATARGRPTPSAIASYGGTTRPRAACPRRSAPLLFERPAALRDVVDLEDHDVAPARRDVVDDRRRPIERVRIVRRVRIGQQLALRTDDDPVERRRAIAAWRRRTGGWTRRCRR